MEILQERGLVTKEEVATISGNLHKGESTLSFMRTRCGVPISRYQPEIDGYRLEHRPPTATGTKESVRPSQRPAGRILSVPIGPPRHDVGTGGPYQDCAGVRELRQYSDKEKQFYDLVEATVKYLATQNGFTEMTISALAQIIYRQVFDEEIGDPAPLRIVQKMMNVLDEACRKLPWLRYDNKRVFRSQAQQNTTGAA